MSQADESKKVRELLALLNKQPLHLFPRPRAGLSATNEHGVYVLRSPKGSVLHVGRTYRGKAGLNQRLRNHLATQSSFANVYLNGNGSVLRKGYTYQFLAVADDRHRALLEYLATAHYCPKHLGVHSAKVKEGSL